MNGRLRLLLVAAVAIAVATAATATGADWGVPTHPIGIAVPLFGELPDQYKAQTAQDVEASTVRIFIDIWKHAGPFWGRVCTNAGVCSFDRAPTGYWSVQTATWRTDGYPATILASSSNSLKDVCADVGFGGANIPAGDYVVRFSGKGTLTFENDAAYVSTRYDSVVTTRIVGYNIRITPRQGMRLCIQSTDATDPLRGISILPADKVATYSDSQPFSQWFLDAMAPASVVRFGPWLKTEYSNNAARTWANRVTMDMRQSTMGGVAVEHIITLCNRLNAAPWLLLPKTTSATDSYHVEFAKLVSQRLKPTLKVYIEYAHGLGYLSWNKNDDLPVWNLWKAQFAENATRLVHVHTSPYIPDIIKHWGTDLPKLDAIAYPMAIDFGFSAPQYFITNGAQLTRESIRSTFRRAVLDQEVSVNSNYQKIRFAGPRMFGYDVGLWLRTTSQHRDDLKGESCFTNWNFPCTVWVWNHNTSVPIQVTMRNHTYPMPWSREVLATANTTALSFLTTRASTSWAAKFRGYIDIPTNGRYTFFLDADDGAVLYIDGVKVVDNDVARVETSGEASASKDLPAGRVKFEVQYWNGNRYARCKLYWSGPTFARQEVPASALSRDLATGARAAGVEVEYYLYSFWFSAMPDWTRSFMTLPTTQPHFNFDHHQWNVPYPPVMKLALSVFYADATRVLRDPSIVTLKQFYRMDSAAAAETFAANELDALAADPLAYGLVMDQLERWRRINPDMMATVPLIRPPCSTGKCPVSGLIVDVTAAPSASPMWQALVDFKAGRRGSLPFTSADVAQPAAPVCNPACQWGLCVADNQCKCFAGYSGPTCTISGAKPVDCAATVGGVNLGGTSDYNTELSFVDIWRRSRDWTPHRFTDYTWDTGATMDIGSDGMPRFLDPNTRVGSMMIRDLSAHGVSGTYVVLYDGDGILTPSMSDIVAVRRGVGRIEVDVKLSLDFNNGFELVLERQNPADPVRNVRVISPGFESSYRTTPFFPVFVQSLEKYKVVRFGSWQNTNNVQPSTWATRTTRNWRSYNARFPSGAYASVPLEDIILLTNMVGFDPWLSVPYNADDDYIRRMAQLLADTLRPDVTVYVEWGNEPWHTGFVSGQYAQVMGAKYQMQEQGNAWYGGLVNEQRLCYVANRTRTISNIWRPILGNRVKVIIQSQEVWPLVTGKVLSCGHTYSYVDAVAIASYFGGVDTDLTHDISMDRILNVDIPADIEAKRSVIRQHFTYANQYNKPIITYESGYGAVGPGGDTDRAIIAARDPRMRAIYAQHANLLLSEGIGLVNQFTSVSTFTKFGSWGLKEASDQAPVTAYKYLGFMDFLNAHARCAAPTYTCPNNCNGGGECLADGTCSCYYRRSGTYCENTDALHHYDCGYQCTFQQGTCVVSSVVDYHVYHTCQCNPGYFGAHCERFSCARNCSWAGQCVDRDICSCYRGFTGATCETDCGCNGHGTCTAAGSCLCDKGYKLSPQGKCVPDCPCATCAAPGMCACSATCKYGACVNGKCACWAGYGGADCSVSTGKRPNTGSTVGMVLGGLPYWGSEWVFVDAFRQGSAWISNWDTSLVRNANGGWNKGPKIALRPDGYPAYLVYGQSVGKLIMRDTLLQSPAGRYTVLYDGEGVLDVGFDAKLVARFYGRLLVDFSPTANLACAATFASYCGDNGFWLTIKATNPANPVRNIRVIMPGFEHVADAAPFHPLFLKSIERYSTLRFMGWQDTNGIGGWESSWADRVLPGGGWNTSRVPLEYAIDLANIVGANPWFNLPHNASTQYAREFGSLVASRLRPDVRVFIEYSNEVWNTFFDAGKFARTKGLAAGLSTDARTAGTRYQAQRSIQLFNAFLEGFGGASKRSHLVHVLSTWAATCATCGPVTTRELLTWNNAYQSIDAVGTTAYFDCNGLTGTRQPQVTNFGISGVLTECGKASAITQTLADIQVIRAIATQYGRPLITYEAGPSLVEASAISSGSYSAAITNIFIGANRHPGMKDVYKAYLQAFATSGLGTVALPYMHFGSTGRFSQYGSFGVLESIQQDVATAPKYLALQEFITSVAGAGVNEGCYNAHTGLVGGGLTMRAGPPIVTAPASRDVWVTGFSATVKWVPGKSAFVQVALFRNSSCAGAAPIAVLSPATRNNGQLTWTVPSALAPGDDYFVSIRDAVSTNFSSPFQIATAFQFATSEWSACDASCGSGYQTRSVTCTTHPSVIMSKIVISSPPSPQDQCTLARNCVQSSYTTDKRCRLCTPTPGNNWALGFNMDSDAQSFCAIDGPGMCRTYHTSFGKDSVLLRHSVNMDIRDCAGVWEPEQCASAAGCDWATVRAGVPAVPLSWCTAVTGADAPIAKRTCMNRPCGNTAWVASDWSACSSACGGGVRTRSVRCVDASLNTVSSAQCTGLAPASSEACNTATCETYAWNAGSWSDCSVTCGPGTQSRSIVCQSEQTGTAALSTKCDASTQPARTRSCNPGACQQYMWVALPWSACSAMCGGGLSTRTVQCESGSAPGIAVQEAWCSDSVRPADNRVCNTVPCVTYTWTAEAWSSCNATCGGGYMSRNVRCAEALSGISAANAKCVGLPRPGSLIACNTQSCSLCGAGACSGHGACSQNTGACSCSSGWTGPQCNTPASCNGLLDADGNCCTGVLTATRQCCNGALDGSGHCCASGVVDQCGVCGGQGTIDVSGKCCAGGVLDTFRHCCASGHVDECGVCDGAGATCKTTISLVVSQVASSDPLSAAFQAFVRAIQSFVGGALSLGDPSLLAVSVNTASGRRLATSGTVVDIVMPAGTNLTGAPVATAAVVESRMATATSGNGVTLVGSPQIARAGVCGNGVCEVGETCSASGTTSDCCIADCPMTIQCPVPSGSTLPCGGDTHGYCLLTSGSCECSAIRGYTGVDCGQCRAGWIKDGADCVPYVAAQAPQQECAVSDWTPWTMCSVTCGSGTSMRYRRVVTDGANCPALSESKTCEGAGQGCGSMQCDTVYSSLVRWYAPLKLYVSRKCPVDNAAICSQPTIIIDNIPYWSLGSTFANSRVLSTAGGSCDSSGM